MAATSSRAHLIKQLSSSRRSISPRTEEYITPNGTATFDAGRDAIHSTMQDRDFPHHHQQPLEYDLASEDGSEGSAEMSIELGRGVKRGARARDEDVSEKYVINMGNDSFYEVTATPPFRPRDAQRKADEGLRRQASVRRATAAAKTNEGTKHAASVKSRSLSAALKDMADEETSFTAEEYTATYNAHNTRFSRSRQASGNEPTFPTRFTSGSAQAASRPLGGNNPTAQSNSFILPDLPNINELVSGVRKDGTPVFNRNTKSRSRFSSAFSRPTRSEHYPVDSVPVPEEEKAIYASLQLLKERVDQLEMEKSEAQKRAEEYESEIIELRSQLAVALRRPDSALGSDEDVSGSEKWKKEKTKLQAHVKAGQDRLNRSERKASVSDIAAKRMTKERDELVTQIGVAYYNNEELKAENEAFKESHGRLQAQNEELMQEVDDLRKENQDLRLLMRQTDWSYDNEWQRRASESKERKQKIQGPARRNKEESMVRSQADQAKRPRSAGLAEDLTRDDLATRIAEAVRKRREEATAKVHSDRMSRQQGAMARSRSKSATRQQPPVSGERGSGPKRNVSAPAEAAGADAESTTQLDFFQKSRIASKRLSLPSAAKPRTAMPAREEDSRDLTLLSWLDPNEVLKLRKKLEEEHRARRLNQNRANLNPVEAEVTQQTAQGLPRKSSLKDVTSGWDDGAAQFGAGGANLDEFAKIAKSVRVQSPHTSDADIDPQQQQGAEQGDDSVVTNTSRRRRRAASLEGMTSAFILPDITLSASQAARQPSISHDSGNCTACPPSSTNNVKIPSPTPVTDREVDLDVTNATIRPSQPPPLALATVIKQLEDEISHLKIQLTAQQRLYNQHEPALSKRRRIDVKALMDKLTAEIEKRSDQVYALYDVLEGQKQHNARAARFGQKANEMNQREVEETLSNLGIDPVELSGRVGRKSAPSFGLDGADEMSANGSMDLPWDGFGELGSEEEFEHARTERRRSGVY